jgi:hypothetical protein
MKPELKHVKFYRAMASVLACMAGKIGYRQKKIKIEFKQTNNKRRQIN